MALELEGSLELISELLNELGASEMASEMAGSMSLCSEMIMALRLVRRRGHVHEVPGSSCCVTQTMMKLVKLKPSSSFAEPSGQINKFSSVKLPNKVKKLSSCKVKLSLLK